MSDCKLSGTIYDQDDWPVNSTPGATMTTEQIRAAAEEILTRP